AHAHVLGPLAGKQERGPRHGWSRSRLDELLEAVARGAAGNPAERLGGQGGQIQGAAVSGSPRNPRGSWGGDHRSERIQHPGSPRSLLRGVDTRSEERRSLLGGPRLRGMARGRWTASGVPTKPASWGGQAPKIRTGFSAAPLEGAAPHRGGRFRGERSCSRGSAGRRTGRGASGDGVAGDA